MQEFLEDLEKDPAINAQLIKLKKANCPFDFSGIVKAAIATVAGVNPTVAIIAPLVISSLAAELGKSHPKSKQQTCILKIISAFAHKVTAQKDT